jgi:hypothetical protein
MARWRSAASIAYDTPSSSKRTLSNKSRRILPELA